MDTSLIDPEIRQFIARMRADWDRHPPLASLPLPQARAVAEEVRAPWRQGGPAMALTRELNADTAAGPLRLRLHYPAAPAPTDPAPTAPNAGALLPVLAYLHGGGFTLFSIDTHDRLMREYAAAAGCVVVGVDYPLAPEAKYPVALNRLVALAGWLAEHGAALGLDAARLALGGDSAGGNLALAAALRLRDAGRGHAICGLLLNYGAFDSHCSDAAEALHGGPGAILDRAEMQYYWANYLRTPADAEDPYACPIHAALAGLPPCFLAVAELDVIAEQSHAMAAALAAAGVRADLRVYQGATHSFLEAMSVSALARAAIADGAAFLKEVLA